MQRLELSINKNKNLEVCNAKSEMQVDHIDKCAFITFDVIYAINSLI